MKQKSNYQLAIPSFLIEKYDYDQDLRKIKSHKNSNFTQEFNFTVLEDNFERLKKKLDIDKLESLIKTSFKSFDIENKGEMDIDDIRNCVFTMNLCPNDVQFNEIFKKMKVSFAKRKKNQSELMNGSKISYETFSRVMLPILVSGELDTKSEELLEKAFKVISDGEEKVDWKKLEDLLCSYGEKFKSEEIEHMAEFVNKFIDKNFLLFKSYVPFLSREIDHESFFKNSDTFSKKEILKNLGFNLNESI
ncbi:ef-hand calcium-binding domain-containing 2 [Brachionus plicatilis]|uniref:Ef-hand calcium-binding domain-containing 2 n=1 Tax=Brachionus plicatilis TaxID=10195 RepID=A0A3M7SNH2_BRAPC|nr:ef-hand calcium-binding domain-containing 2 [Brachionus plicatilis]